LPTFQEGFWSWTIFLLSDLLCWGQVCAVLLHFYLLFLWRSAFSKQSRGAWWQRCNSHLLARSFILEPKTCVKGKGSPLCQQSVREVFSARCLHLFASHRGGLDYLFWSKVHFLGQIFPWWEVWQDWQQGLAVFAVFCFISVFLTLLLNTVDCPEFFCNWQSRGTGSTATVGIGHQVKQRNPWWASCPLVSSAFRDFFSDFGVFQIILEYKPVFNRSG